ncbi:citrate lyase holo-[acyl-carrier protein] synthase [Prevotella sp.]|uniref:citrate lyase holo-[acyl-carrier protein] synthase n=1 Tax=Prevotella sp. TaxID=59823 RepID=UPI0027E30964|nr:citrate lyase holo-[acyl-carrier protein] synthase [Prevotella sp.]
MVTLNELLASRDSRHAMQQKLLAEHSGKTLVCLTVVMPGSVKRNQQSLIVAHAAVEQMIESYELGVRNDELGVRSYELGVRNDELEGRFGGRLIECDLETGYEAYLITDLPLLEAKRIAVQIEDTHPLGRLFDIDIIDKDGVPVSRDRVGSHPRRCLVCNREARYCMRMRWHTQEEIWERINAMVDESKQISDNTSQMV